MATSWRGARKLQKHDTKAFLRQQTLLLISVLCRTTLPANSRLVRWWQSRLSTNFSITQCVFPPVTWRCRFQKLWHHLQYRKLRLQNRPQTYLVWAWVCRLHLWLIRLEWTTTFLYIRHTFGRYYPCLWHAIVKYGIRHFSSQASSKLCHAAWEEKRSSRNTIIIW